MNYEVILSPQAEQDFSALPLPLQNYLEHQLQRLAASPTTDTRPAAFPYPTGSQLFQPDEVVLDEQCHEFTILFRYGQDEKSLQIVGIGHITRE